MPIFDEILNGKVIEFKLCHIEHKVMNNCLHTTLNDCWSKLLWHMFYKFFPTASTTTFGLRPKFFRAEHSATAEGGNCAYGPTMLSIHTMLKSYRFFNKTIKKKLQLIIVIRFTHFLHKCFTKKECASKRRKLITMCCTILTD